MAEFLSFRLRSGWRSLLVILLGGMTIGMLLNFAEASGIPGASDFGNYFGLWIFLVTLIAVGSHSWQWAALHAVTFLLAMLVTYYLSTLLFLGYFLAHLLRAWAVVAILFAPPFAALAWHGMKTGWCSAFGTALPIGLLLYEAFSLRLVFPLHGVQVVFNIMASIVLFWIGPSVRVQWLRVFVFIPLIIASASVINEHLLPIVRGFRF